MSTAELLNWASSEGAGEKPLDAPVPVVEPAGDLLAWANSAPPPAPATKKVTKMVPMGEIATTIELDEPDVRPENMEQALLYARVRPGSWEDSQQYVAERMPFAGGVVSAASIGAAMISARRVEQGKATSKDYMTVADLLVAGERETDKSVLRKIEDVVTMLPGYAVEFGVREGLTRLHAWRPRRQQPRRWGSLGRGLLERRLLVLQVVLLAWRPRPQPCRN